MNGHRTNGAQWNQLNEELDRWIRRLRVQRLLRWGGRGLAAGLAVGLAAAVFALLRSTLLPGGFVALLAAGGLAGLALGAAAGYFWRVPRLPAARAFDLSFGLHERVSTALELAAQPDIAAAWREPQLEDAVQAARGVALRERLPLRVDRYGAGLALLLVLAAGLIWSQAGPRFQAAQQAQAVQQAIEAESERVEALIEEIETAPNTLTPEQRQALMEPLEEALRRLQEAQSLEAAVSALNSAEGQLQALAQDEALAQTLEGLESAGERLRDLSQDSGSPLEGLGESLAQGDLQEAARQLESIDPGSLNAKQAQALAGELAQAAESLQDSNPELAEQLRQAAEDLEQGDAQEAQARLSEAAQALRETAQEAAGAQAAGQAAGELAQSQDRLAQRGSSAVAQGGQAQPGAAQGNGAGQSPPGDGQSPGSAGAGRGEANGEEPAGGEAGAAPIPQDNGPGDGGERPFDPVYAPERLGGDPEEGLGLPGSGEPGDQVVGQGETTPGEEEASQVPYVDVLPAYLESYREALDRGLVPQHLRPVIRDYFSGLEP